MKNFMLCMLTALALLAASCEEEKNAKIEVWLTDAPGDFQEVNIDLIGVEIHSSETDNERGWQSLEVTPAVIDLLQLTNGEETLLGDLELPGGRLSQIRLKLGENNTIKVDDQVHALQTPAAQQSGLKVKLNEILAEGITYKIVLDFDASKSIVQTGNGSYILKPVIRALTKAQDGAIKGVVEPARSISISVLSGEETVSTTTSNDNGEFLIRGLAAGKYKLLFGTSESGALAEKDDVNVTLGETTDVGTVVAQ